MIKTIGKLLVCAVLVWMLLPRVVVVYPNAMPTNSNKEVPVQNKEVDYKALLKQEVERQGLTNRDYLILEKIAQAESGFKHFDNNNNVLRGKINNLDMGLFQINLRYHQKQAENMNLNLELISDNIKYAVWLYSKENTKPWNWSKKDWNK